MNIIAPYGIDLPEFEYDNNELISVTEDQEWVNRNCEVAISSGSVETGGEVSLDAYMKGTDEEEHSWKEIRHKHILSIPLVKEMAKRTTCRTHPLLISFWRMSPGFHLPAHIDLSTRNTTLMFPLTPDPAPIRYFDEDDNVACELPYLGATLINGQIKHDVIVTEPHERWMFQIGLLETFDEVVEKLETGTFWR